MINLPFVSQILIFTLFGVQKDLDQLADGVLLKRLLPLSDKEVIGFFFAGFYE